MPTYKLLGYAEYESVEVAGTIEAEDLEAAENDAYDALEEFAIDNHKPYVSHIEVIEVVEVD